MSTLPAALLIALVTLAFYLALSKADEKNDRTMDYWLPKHVVPEEYLVSLTPRIDNFTFDAVVKIHASIKEETTRIVLHADEVEIRRVNVTDGERALDVESVSKSDKYQFLTLSLRSTLSRGTNVSVEIAYTGKINSQMRGLFRNSYRVGNETKYVMATQLEPTWARKLLPCFDEPAFKARFSVTVKVPGQNYTALSNMPVRSLTKDGIFAFEPTPPMSTYLLAIVVSEFENLSSLDHRYNVDTRPDLANQLPYALSVMPKMIDYFESRLNISYPLPKLDMVAVPDFPGIAMENWGLHVYSEYYMLHDDKVTPLSLKRYIRGLITHEIAHQWFGNLVSPKSWDYTWLNEGFAEYFEYHAYEDELASWDLESVFVATDMVEALSFDATTTTYPITNRVYSPSEIESMFDTITYSKAACVIRMLRRLIGSELFFAGLSRYVRQNQYSVGTPDSLFEAIEAEIRASDFELNTTVAELMNSWTLQAGYPVVDVRLEGEVLIVRQKRFFVDPTSGDGVGPSSWIVPLTWATASEPSFEGSESVRWLTKREDAVKDVRGLDRDWIVFNVQSTGFYRVNYDDVLWGRIANLLRSGEHEIVHHINRASLLDDLLNLGRAGAVGYDRVLATVQYLANETSYVPWKAAVPGFTYLKKRLREYPEVYGPFKNYMVTLLEPHYRRLGYDEVAGEKDFDVLLREIVLNELCSFGHEDCVNRSFQMFDKARRDESFRISPNQQFTVSCVVSKYGNDEQRDYLSDRFEGSIYAAEKYNLIMGLTCTSNSTYLQNLLLKVTTPQYGVKKEHVKDVFEGVASNSDTGLVTLLDFVEKNYKRVLNFVEDESVIQAIFESISESLSTDLLIKKYADLVENNKQSMSNILESMRNITKNSLKELEWNKRNSLSILKWLTSNMNTS